MLTCPNGCTVEDDNGNETPAEMEFGFHFIDNKPGYACAQCGAFEYQSERGRL